MLRKRRKNFRLQRLKVSESLKSGASGRKYHSDLKLSTGFSIAALIDWKLTVNNAITKATHPETMNIQGLNSIWYAKF
jgi:hypothetical protein